MQTRRSRRKGQMLVIAACGLALLGMVAALTIDIGHMFTMEASMQNASDAASRAAVFTFIQEKIDGASESEARARAAAEAQDIARLNVPHARCEIEFGRFDMTAKSFTVEDASVPATASRVRIFRDSNSDSEPVGLFFASLAGIQEVDVSSSSTTRGGNNVIGIREGGGLRPIAVPEDAIGNWEPGDPVTIPVPSHANTSDNDSDPWITPGNWGWLDYNGDANGVPELRDWLENGYDEDFELNSTDSDGRLCSYVPGSPGMRTSLRPSVDSMVGDEVVVCIYDQATGEGSNGQFRIVGFLGLKITGTTWRGGDQNSEVEAVVVGISDDASALLGSGGSTKSNVFVIQLVQ